MKIINKTNILEDNINQEIETMKKIQNDHVIKLYDYFEDKDS